MRFEIKNYKSLSSGAYTATIYKDGRRWALVEDDGHGGQPTVSPVGWKEDGPLKYWQARDAIEADLHNWAQTAVPDWYLTNHGEWDALEPNWESAIGYLIEIVENNRQSRKGWLVRTPDGQYFRTTSLTPEAFAFAIGKGAVWVEGGWRSR